jgi:hypothetical protein
MVLVNGQILYVRTGGQFTRLKDGETVERGSYGVSALDARTGKVLWRYKGADKGITNLVVPDPDTILVADHDDLIVIDSHTGKRRARVPHRIERASFGLLNERGAVVIGGQSEIAAFDPVTGRELWRDQHTPPGRGVLRTITAIAARAASLYFRFGGTVTTALRAVQLAHTAASFSWSGLAARSSVSNLQALAISSTRNYANSRLRQFGIASRLSGNGLNRNLPTGSLTRGRTADVQDRLLDRLDPAHQLERLSRFLWHRDRLAVLRGHWMYFYTDLKIRGGHGLAGVNLNTGETEREIRLNDLDERFVTDEPLGLMYVSSGNRLQAYSVNSR